MGKQMKRDILWLISFLLFFFMVLYKCRFGFANIDETFLMTVPYRLLQGDSLFLHEWHLSQLSSVLSYPFVKAYYSLTGSTESLLLTMRYVFTVLHSANAVFLYAMLRKKTAAAYWCSLIYLLYTPFGIMTLSYNSMGLGFMLITCTLLYTNQRNSKLVNFLAGLAFSGSVLCCPYLIVVYVGYGLTLLVLRWRKGKSIEGFLYFTGGCVVAAAVFCCFLFSRIGIIEFIRMIPCVLENDPEHPSKSIVFAAVNYVVRLIGDKHYNAAPALLLIIGLLFVIRKDPLREKHVARYSAMAVVLVIVYLLSISLDNEREPINHTMIPMSIIGIVCYALFPKENRHELLYFWVPGILYGFCVNWSSNLGYYVICNAAMLCTLGGVIMLQRTLPQGNWHKSFRSYILPVFLITLAIIRYETLFWDYGGMENMTYEISVGAEKGILASPNVGRDYEDLYQETETIRNHSGETVVYFSTKPWLYLDDEKHNGSFSAWLSGTHTGTANRLITYYEYNPEKLPDAVYFPKEGTEDARFLVTYFEDLGYVSEETETAYLLEKN